MVENTQKWNPKKTYILKATDTFTFTGPEFNFIYQCLLSYGEGSVTDMKAIKAIQDAFTVIHNKFVEMVENGSIQERQANEEILDTLQPVELLNEASEPAPSIH